MNHIAARGLLLAGVSTLALVAAVSAVHAQSVDYGALEQLYGEPVTTSATGTPQKVSEVPANMEIITQDDIRRSGADNIPDILQFVTGVEVRRYGFADADVAVRGMNQPWNPRLLVLVNGRQVYSDDYGYVPWQALGVELDQIRQIEIVKGPNTALFGFNAVSGVINIITYDPLYDSINTVTARGGTQSLAEGSAVITGHSPDGNAGVQAGVGGYEAREYWSHYTATLAPIPQPERGDMNMEGKWRAAPGIVIELGASDVSSSNAGQNSAGRLGDFKIRNNSFRAGVTADSPIGVLSFDAYRNESTTDTLSSSAVYFWKNDVYVVKAADLLKLNDQHTFRFGVEWRDNELNSDNGVGTSAVGGTIGYKVLSGSGMWNWQIDPKWSLTNAVRVDHLTLSRAAVADADGFTNGSYDGVSHTEMSFNSGLVYTFD